MYNVKNDKDLEMFLDNLSFNLNNKEINLNGSDDKDELFISDFKYMFSKVFASKEENEILLETNNPEKVNHLNDDKEKILIAIPSKEEEEEKNFETISYNINKTKNKVRVGISTFIWEDEFFCVLKIDDMNLEEEIQILKEIDKSKDNILASVTHDLRTPLNSTKFLLNECKTEKNLDVINKNIDIALANSDLLMNLINDILDYSQIKEKRIKLNHSDFALDEMINEIICKK